MSSEAGYSLPIASRLPKRSVHLLAVNVAKDVGYEPGGDLMNILHKMGGRVVYRDFTMFDDGDSGSLIVERPGHFEIHIATNTSPIRDRFTIAHEIGHYVLHYLWPRKNGKSIQKMKAARFGSDRAEWEANWFAAAFLMPEIPFRNALEEGSIAEVAERFGVSLRAAEVRATELGIS